MYSADVFLRLHSGTVALQANTLCFHDLLGTRRVCMRTLTLLHPPSESQIVRKLHFQPFVQQRRHLLHARLCLTNNHLRCGRVKFLLVKTTLHRLFGYSRTVSSRCTRSTLVRCTLALLIALFARWSSSRAATSRSCPSGCPRHRPSGYSWFRVGFGPIPRLEGVGACSRLEGGRGRHARPSRKPRKCE